MTQKDLTQYPVVRLYLDVRDSGNKQVIKNLANHMFFISEKAANNADYVKRQVDKAVLMNENERLNINLLADTSGSMKGDNLQSKKYYEEFSCHGAVFRRRYGQADAI